MRCSIRRSVLGAAALGRALVATLAAALASAAPAGAIGCGVRAAATAASSHADPVEALATCPRDAARDPSGRCACLEGSVAVLGACVPPTIGDAFCGAPARFTGGSCAFPPCHGRDLFDIAAGSCVPRESVVRTAGPCPAASAPIVEDGRLVCAPADASCPRDRRFAGGSCVEEVRCPPGTLARDTGCRPFVFEDRDEGKTRVDVGVFAGVALGVDGGEGSPALCRPLLQRPDLFDASFGPQTVFVHVTLLVPDQDLSRLRVDVSARSPTGRLRSPEADRAVATAVTTLLEPLRGLGDESSVAAVPIEVRCAVGTGPR